jgi:hypothetical protein
MKEKIGFKIQQEVINQKLNYFTQATLKDAEEANLEVEIDDQEKNV